MVLRHPAYESQPYRYHEVMMDTMHLLNELSARGYPRWMVLEAVLHEVLLTLFLEYATDHAYDLLFMVADRVRRDVGPTGGYGSENSKELNPMHRLHDDYWRYGPSLGKREGSDGE